MLQTHLIIHTNLLLNKINLPWSLGRINFNIQRTSSQSQKQSQLFVISF